MTTDLRELWADVHVGQPPLDQIVRAGERRRRTSRGLAVLGAAASTAVVVGVLSLWSPEEAVTPAPSAPTVAQDTQTLYYLLDEPGERYEAATLLTPREVVVADTGDPGYDALHALLTSEPPGAGLSVGFNFIGDDTTTDVESVEHAGGVIRVDLTGHPYDPYPSYDMCCVPDGATVVQQIVHTLQAAYDTTDPVVFADRAVWFHRIGGPVEADPSRVVPSEQQVALATLPPADGHVQPYVGGRVQLRQDGCVTLDGVPTVWPYGWTAWQVGGRVVMLDPEGRLAVRGGDEIGASGAVSRRVEVSGPCLVMGEPAAVILGDVTVGS